MGLKPMKFKYLTNVSNVPKWVIGCLGSVSVIEGYEFKSQDHCWTLDQCPYSGKYKARIISCLKLTLANVYIFV